MKSFTDISQSTQLQKILPIESADMCFYYKDDVPQLVPFSKHNNRFYIPCWSLAALLDVLPYPIIEQDYNGKWACRTTHKNTVYLWEDYNPVDSCVKMILKLKEENLI